MLFFLTHVALILRRQRVVNHNFLQIGILAGLCRVQLRTRRPQARNLQDAHRHFCFWWLLISVQDSTAEQFCFLNGCLKCWMPQCLLVRPTLPALQKVRPPQILCPLGDAHSLVCILPAFINADGRVLVVVPDMFSLVSEDLWIFATNSKIDDLVLLQTHERERGIGGTSCRWLGEHPYFNITLGLFRLTKTADFIYDVPQSIVSSPRMDWCWTRNEKAPRYFQSIWMLHWRSRVSTLQNAK